MEFDGEFETHVTVRLDDPGRADALRAWADRNGLAFHHIVLDRGDTPSQPMISRRGSGALSDERAAAAEMARGLIADGFAVSRVKIEAAPDNRDVPETDADATAHSDRYFEHHVKLVLGPAADLGPLAELAGRHAARMSRNARRIRTDGRAERFVTQRCHGVGRTSAADRLNDLTAALTAAGYEILSAEQEFVVSDTNPGVDAGWLDPEGTP